MERIRLDGPLVLVDKLQKVGPLPIFSTKVLFDRRVENIPRQVSDSYKNLILHFKGKVDNNTLLKYAWMLYRHGNVQNISNESDKTIKELQNEEEVISKSFKHAYDESELKNILYTYGSKMFSTIIMAILSHVTMSALKKYSKHPVNTVKRTHTRKSKKRKITRKKTASH